MAGAGAHLKPTIARIEALGPANEFFLNRRNHSLCQPRGSKRRRKGQPQPHWIADTGKGRRKLGFFVGSDNAKQRWLGEKVETWVAGVNCLAGFSREFPQTTYAGLTMSLQQEWKFVRRATPRCWDPIFFNGGGIEG